MGHDSRRGGSMIAQLQYSRPRGTRSVIVSRNGRPAMISAALAFATVALSGGTSPAQATSINPFRVQQSSPLPQYVARKEDISSALHEVKDTAGLTWDQLAAVFGVSRKSIHNWLSSNKIGKTNRAAVLEVLDQVRSMAGEKSFKIRKALLGDKFPLRSLATADGPVLESSGDVPRHRTVASEDNTLKILE